MKNNQPLFGHHDGLLYLFSGFDHAVPVTQKHGVNQYVVDPGYVPLLGLPGCVRDGYATFVRLQSLYASELQKRFTNGVIGGFRVIRSAELMKQGLLPVYAFDFHRHTSILIATVPYSEHERFNRGI